MSDHSATTTILHERGESEGSVDVSIGPRFLELFSENLYSSPNKAFEELVANSWDAGATCVYISIPPDLQVSGGAISIIDDGGSMDFAGLQQLWAVASSNKRELKSPPRPQIGKFGIGKLATYILANEVTYICKAHDGVIRAVTMDYRDIARANEKALHTSPLPLEVRRLEEAELSDVLLTFPGGDLLLEQIKQKIKPPNSSGTRNEDFGGPTLDTQGPKTDTWTLALLTSLKPEGKALQVGRLRWILRTALPLSPSITIVLNRELLEPSKIDAEVAEEWRLGQNLHIPEIELPDETTIKVQELTTPIPHISIGGIRGQITGRVLLFKNKITGGKSDTLGPSNGFFINILGRVVNYQNTDFGLENLSHGAWAQFRATIRADGLDEILSVERDGLREGKELDIFKAFLRAIFNKARVSQSSLEAASWPNAGDILEKSWNALPLLPLANLISERLDSASELPDIVDSTGISNKKESLEEWNRLARTQPGELIREIRQEELAESLPLAKYDLANRSLIVNAGHPFYREHSSTYEEKLLLRDLALVDFLSDAHMLDIGIDPGLHRDARRYRDQLFRLLAQLSRRTGAQIAKLLIDSISHSKGLELAVGEALRYLGFEVTEIGGKGEPEGVAKAPLTPGQNDARLTFSFTYEAKSTGKTNARVSNKDVGAGRIARHRANHSADYSLVIAPDYELGALQDECRTARVTPMRAEDLARILILTASTGILNFSEFRTIFDHYDPNEVHEWIEQLEARSQPSGQLTIDTFLSVMDEIGFEGPDTLSVTVIADRIRQRGIKGMKSSRTEIRNLVSGLQILIPSIVRISGDEVFLSASPEKIRHALLDQIGRLPEGLRSRLNISVGA